VKRLDARLQALHATQQFTPLWETLKEEFNAVTFATGQVCGLFSYALRSCDCLSHSLLIAFLISSPMLLGAPPQPL